MFVCVLDIELRQTVACVMTVVSTPGTHFWSCLADATSCLVLPLSLSCVVRIELDIFQYVYPTGWNGLQYLKEMHHSYMYATHIASC